MKWVADENIDRAIVEALRREGEEVWYVADARPGIEDDEVLDRANRDEAVLLTADKGFGEFVFLQRRATHGVVLLRMSGLTPERKAQVLLRVRRERAAGLVGAFSVVTAGGVRIRRRS